MSSTDEVSRTKILLLGLRRSGKTSIRQALFNSMVPKETIYLDATMRTVKHTYDTIIPLEIWDCPGNITVETLGVSLSVFSALVFVIDIRDLYNQPISRLVEFIVAAYHQNPSLNLEILVHKAEKLNEDEKIENFRQINERVMDRLMDAAEMVEGPDSQVNFMEFVEQQMNFHLTSIFDHSLHQAFSVVLQRLIDLLPYIEDLLNIYCANNQASKAFLFDAQSRLYVATDLSPVDSATHNLCCDNLAMLNSFGELYRSVSASPARRRRGNPEPPSPSSDIPSTPPPSATSFNGKPPMELPSSSSSSSASSSRARTPQTPSHTQTSSSASSLTIPSTPTSSPTVKSPAKSSAPALRTSHSRSNLPIPSHLRLPNSNSSPSVSSAQFAHSDSHSRNPAPNLRSKLSGKPLLKTPQDLFYPSGATSLHPSSLPSSSSAHPGTTIMWHLLTAPELIVEELGLVKARTEEEEKSPKSGSNSKSISDSNSSSSSVALDGESITSISASSTSTSRPPQTRVETETVAAEIQMSTYPNPTLILLVLLPTSVWETRRGLVELNLVAVREGVQEIVDVERELRGLVR